MALPLADPTPLHARESDISHLAPHRIKRCTYRRLISIERPEERLYEVECLYPDRLVPIPLGDLDTSLPICNACTRSKITSIVIVATWYGWSATGATRFTKRSARPKRP